MYICIYVYICVYICTCTHMYMYMLGLAWLRAQPRKWKTICFTVFSAANVSKTSVLSTLRSKTLINCVQFHTFCKTCSTFTENPCAKMQKTKKSEKTIMFYMKNCKKGSFLMRILGWKSIFAPGTSRHQDFVDFLILRYVEVFCVSLRMLGVCFLTFCSFSSKVSLCT